MFSYLAYRHCCHHVTPPPLSAAFFEERAILLGRLGRHEQALTIYVHILRDPQKALEYCRQHYSADRPADTKVRGTTLQRRATDRHQGTGDNTTAPSDR